MSIFEDYPSNSNELNECFLQWQRTNKVLRFGQYMITFFAKSGTVYPELYYKEDPIVALGMCVDEIYYEKLEGG